MTKPKTKKAKKKGKWEEAGEPVGNGVTDDTAAVQGVMGADGAVSKVETGEKRTCPECGILNDKSRVVCEICKYKFYNKETTAKNRQKELWALNKDLMNAIKSSDKVSADATRVRIKELCDGSKGVFEQDEVGYAKQLKATKADKRERPKAKPKVLHNCPCCGEETKSYFVQGHDGRIKGMFRKIDKAKMKQKELNPVLQRMFQHYKKGLSLKECAQKMEK